jgi:deoxyribodipyrimidine photo-lyase
MTHAPIILWFRNDLRLGDHRALTAAVKTGAPIILLYVLDDETLGSWKMGGASRWWLHHSLASLANDIAKKGNNLILRRGSAREIVPKVAAECGAAAVYFSRHYEPSAVALEADLNSLLEERGITCKRFSGALLREPEDIRTKAGDAFKVYTPFWRALSSEFSVGKPITPPVAIPPPSKLPKSDTLASLQLLPRKLDWPAGLAAEWNPGEAGANARLDAFLDGPMKDYAEARNRPDIPGTSRLSPHLHFGEITPALCWYRSSQAAARNAGSDKGHETFLKEIVWREFAHTLLFYWPNLPEAPFRPEFSAFPWSENAEHLTAWQRGQTGFPIVDAGMRELWTTGYMHNRVRMITASFLIKDLLVPWQRGEEWFWDTLVDADLANNAAGWQWVAGCGADAAPYFRIFNPVTQGEKFDPNGDYVRTWVPEISKLPTEHIHAPWDAPEDVRAASGVVLGKTYPLPLVDHAAARARALAAFARVKSSAQK